MFDIVICHGPNDDNMLLQNLKYNAVNIQSYRNIYIITHDRSLTHEKYTVLHESIFPFSIDSLKTYHNSQNNRYGWYLQQLIKLYASLIIPGILDKYLIIDCDTIFLRPVSFIQDNKLLYNVGTEYHKPYFDHMKRMCPNLEKQNNHSGICHHMIFDKYYIESLINMVETSYNLNNKTSYKFHEIFMRCIEPNHFNKSGASEYEIYFNFMLKYNADKILIRPLQWKNNGCNINNIDKITNKDYVSIHWYAR